MAMPVAHTHAPNLARESATGWHAGVKSQRRHQRRTRLHSTAHAAAAAEGYSVAAPPQRSDAPEPADAKPAPLPAGPNQGITTSRCPRRRQRQSPAPNTPAARSVSRLL